MKQIFCCIISLFAIVVSNAKPAPYKKIQKLFDKGKYADCRDAIYKQLGSASAEDRFFLYCIEMRCFNAQYKTDKNLNTLKKAFNSGKKMMHKFEGILPEFSITALNELYNNLRENQTVNSEIVHGIYQNLFTTFGHPLAGWEAYQYFLKQGESYMAFMQLRNALQADELLRSQNINIKFDYAYLVYFKEKLRVGDIETALDYFIKSKKYFPQNDSFCIVASNDFIEHISEFSTYYYQNIQKVNEYLQELRLSACDARQAIELWNQYLYSVFIHKKDRVHAREIAFFLNQHYPKTYDTLFFKNALFNSLNNAVIDEDSIQLSIVLDLFYSSQNQLSKIKTWVFNLASAGNFIAANALLNAGRSVLPLESKKIEIMRTDLKKYIALFLKQNQKLTRRSILAFYDLNAKTTENKVLFITYVQRFVNMMIAAGNYGECMRILKSALRYYPQNETLLAINKNYVLADFNANYIKLKPNFGFNIPGMNAEKCIAGKVEKEDQANFVTMLNYTRRLAGLYDSCTLDEKYNQKAQQAALIMYANQFLTHGPKKDVKCYTEQGAAGAGSSNLSLGHNGINALFGQVNDDGGNNGSVGHRRWILNPRTSVFGHGSGPNSMALYVFGGLSEANPTPVFNDTQDFIAWPCANHFPRQLLCQRWSFSFANANFDSAKVIAKAKGKIIPLEIEEPAYGYGLSTIVWHLKIDPVPESITIEITGVKIKNWFADKGNGPFKYQYTVNLIE